MPRFVALLCLVFVSGLSHAKSVDADFLPLFKERKLSEVEKLANARIAADPADDTAVWFLANAVMNEKDRRAAAITHAEACVAKNPAAARCHQALGRLYGVTAMGAGMLSMMSYASKSKEAMLRAVTLAPKSFDAVRDLNQYYLQAPGIAGGSVAKAIAASEAFIAVDPVLGKVLRAEVHTYQKELDLSEKILAELSPATDAGRSAVNEASIGLAYALGEANQVMRAQALINKRLATDMDNAMLRFALGRALLAAKSYDGAIAEMERAMRTDPQLRGHYRLGMAYQGKGERDKALTAFNAFLAYAPDGKAKDDANARIAQLRKS